MCEPQLYLWYPAKSIHCGCVSASAVSGVGGLVCTSNSNRNTQIYGPVDCLTLNSVTEQSAAVQNLLRQEFPGIDVQDHHKTQFVAFRRWEKVFS